MKDIGLLEQCDKCGGHLTLMESVSNDDGSLWLVKRCLMCYGHGAEEVIQISDASLRHQVEELQADNAVMVKALEKWKLLAHFMRTPIDSRTGKSLEKLCGECIQYGEKALASNPGAALPKERDELKKALELAVDSDASNFCVFNGIEKENWPDYCPNPPETEHATCVKCWKEYFLSQAKEG